MYSLWLPSPLCCLVSVAYYCSPSKISVSSLSVCALCLGGPNGAGQWYIPSFLYSLQSNCLALQLITHPNLRNSELLVCCFVCAKVKQATYYCRLARAIQFRRFQKQLKHVQRSSGALTSNAWIVGNGHSLVVNQLFPLPNSGEQCRDLPVGSQPQWADRLSDRQNMQMSAGLRVEYLWIGTPKQDTRSRFRL